MSLTKHFKSVDMIISLFGVLLLVLGSDQWRTWDQCNRPLWGRQQPPTGEGQRLLQRGTRWLLYTGYNVYLIPIFSLFHKHSCLPITYKLCFSIKLFSNFDTMWGHMNAQDAHSDYISQKLPFCLQVVNMSPGPCWWTWSPVRWTVWEEAASEPFLGQTTSSMVRQILETVIGNTCTTVLLLFGYKKAIFTIMWRRKDFIQPYLVLWIEMSPNWHFQPSSSLFNGIENVSYIRERGGSFQPIKEHGNWI